LKSYVIQNGENLYTIAFKFNVSKELICKVNNAKTFNDLKLITGKRIFIPTLVKRKIV
jgi:LysM repeat protein